VGEDRPVKRHVLSPLVEEGAVGFLVPEWASEPFVITELLVVVVAIPVLILTVFVENAPLEIDPVSLSLL